jgi:sterol 3beta-glucosyltransferase
VTEEDPASDATLGSSEEQDAEDFEEATPRPPYAERPIPLHERLQQQSDSMTIPPSMIRSGSMATVKIQRRVRLAEKLKQVFDLDGIEEVWAGMRRFRLSISLFMFFAQKCHVGYCALSVRSFILCAVALLMTPSVLQGYMYLTNSYLCFFAHMPTREVGNLPTTSYLPQFIFYRTKCSNLAHSTRRHTGRNAGSSIGSS